MRAHLGAFFEHDDSEFFTTLLCQLAAGQLFSFVIYSGFIGGSIGGMADVYARLQKAVGATEALLDMLDEGVEEDSKDFSQTPIIPAENAPAISFQSVNFSYPTRPDVPVLQGFSLDIEPGTTKGQFCAGTQTWRDPKFLSGHHSLLSNAYSDKSTS